MEIGIFVVSTRLRICYLMTISGAVDANGRALPGLIRVYALMAETGTQ